MPGMFFFNFIFNGIPEGYFQAKKLTETNQAGFF